MRAAGCKMTSHEKPRRSAPWDKRVGPQDPRRQHSPGASPGASPEQRADHSTEQPTGHQRVNRQGEPMTTLRPKTDSHGRSKMAAQPCSTATGEGVVGRCNLRRDHFLPRASCIGKGLACLEAGILPVTAPHHCRDIIWSLLLFDVSVSTLLSSHHPTPGYIACPWSHHLF